MGSSLPDEIWRRIMEMGVQSSKLSCKDLCCLAVSCKRLHRLSNDKALWSTMLTRDFSSKLPQSPPSKALYRTRFERDKIRRVAAYRRASLNILSQIAVCHKNLNDNEWHLSEEREKTRTILTELKSLEKVRQASVALNVWQPEIIRTQQKQIVEQSSVPVDFRIHTLHMELKVCKQQIAKFTRASEAQKQQLDVHKERLASLKYHPLNELQICSDEHSAKPKKKTRKDYTAAWASRSTPTASGMVEEPHLGTRHLL